MDKNVREATERLVQFHDEYDYTYWDGNKSPWCPNADGVTVARAYLAEHPSDDEEPITEDWLRSVGFEDGTTLSGTPCLALWRIPGKPIDWFKGLPSGFLIGAQHFDIATRGRLRQFARALGIPLSDSNTGKG